MYFDSIEAMMTMDGHGIYVWPAYLITIAVIAFILLSPQRRQRRILTQRAQELRREQRQQQTHSHTSEAN